ncbi:MAG: zinc-ribbon domain-containing protein [Phycisphaerae bacterium]|jgi:hypothetical protein
MAMTNCRECGKEISDSAVMCPSCGAPRKPEFKMTAENKKFMWGVLLVLIFGGGIINFVFGSRISLVPLIVVWVIAMSIMKKQARRNHSEKRPEKPASAKPSPKNRIKAPSGTSLENDPRFNKNRRDFT